MYNMKDVLEFNKKEFFFNSLWTQKKKKSLETKNKLHASFMNENNIFAFQFSKSLVI